jgi:hypothetical protein
MNAVATPSAKKSAPRRAANRRRAAKTPAALSLFPHPVLLESYVDALDGANRIACGDLLFDHEKCWFDYDDETREIVFGRHNDPEKNRYVATALPDGFAVCSLPAIADMDSEHSVGGRTYVGTTAQIAKLKALHAKADRAMRDLEIFVGVIQ